MAEVRERLQSVQYDGTNGQVIADMITNGEVQSDNGVVLVVIDGGSDYTIELNQWIVFRELSAGAPGTYRKPAFIGDSTAYAARYEVL